MQNALRECITTLQSVFVQRHTIISTKKTQDEVCKQQVTTAATSMVPPTPTGEYQMSSALDQSFAGTHMQIFTAISHLQRRMLLIQSGISSVGLGGDLMFGGYCSSGNCHVTETPASNSKQGTTMQPLAQQIDGADPKPEIVSPAEHQGLTGLKGAEADAGNDESIESMFVDGPPKLFGYQAV